MRKIGAEIASGVAIFVAFGIFVFGFIYLKNVTFQRDRYTVQIVFNDVTGLEPGDFVSISGLRIGKVSRFRLEGVQVIVSVQVDPAIELPVDSHAEMKSLGMVGEKFIDISPGVSDDFLSDGDSISGLNIGDLGDITSSVDDLIKQTQELLIRMKAAFENVFDIPTQKALKESIFHLRNISSSLDDNSEHLERTLVNLDSLSGSMNELMSARRHQIESTIENVHQASTHFDGLTGKLDSTLISVQALLATIENQEGALGKVIYSDEFYNEVRHLTGELDTLVQDLKKRPQRYFNLGFIKVF